MKNLKNYKEEIHKCSKCGLCQSVCPTYLETGNECTVSRGQFVMLQGVIKGDLKLNRTINKYLDMCLKCGKCSDFCPSDINIVDIILAAKSEFFEKSMEGKIISFLQSKLIFNTFLKFLKLFKSRKKFPKKFDKKAIYFGGCIENINPKASEYTKYLLNKINIEVIDVDFNCCGLPFLTSGNIKRFQEQATENIKKLLAIDFDYIVTDCASCQWAWMEYKKYIDDTELINKLENIKFKTIYELIEENNLEFYSKVKHKITYHAPCHNNCENIVKKIKNIEYIKLKENQCCGLSALTKPTTWKLFMQLAKKKKKNINSTNADIILTNCVGCLIVLKLITCFKLKCMSIMDFLGKTEIK